MLGYLPSLVPHRLCGCVPLPLVVGLIQPLPCCVGSPGLTVSVLQHVLSGVACVGCRPLLMLCRVLGLHIGCCAGSGGPSGFLI